MKIINTNNKYDNKIPKNPEIYIFKKKCYIFNKEKVGSFNKNYSKRN